MCIGLNKTGIISMGYRRLREVIANLTEGPMLGLIGESRVNVVLLNLALDEIK